MSTNLKGIHKVRLNMPMRHSQEEPFVVELDGFSLKGIQDIKIDKPLSGLPTIEIKLIVSDILGYDAK